MDPFVTLLLIILFVSLWSAVRAKFKLAKVNVIALCALILYVFSLPILSISIVETWEQDIKKYVRTDSQVDYIVVLGCGHIQDENLPLSNRLSTCSLRRLTEGLFVQKSLGEVPLVFTGGKGWNTNSHAGVMGKVAQELGVPNNLIVLIETGNTTFQEAEALHDLLFQKRIVLVTNASHMKRALAVFSNIETAEIIPAPTNFYGLRRQPHTLLNFIPSINNLAIVAKYTHEEFGRFYTSVMNNFIDE
jgi:uncharacterized SAM-binding protein YcdF (DUF218 family)